MEWIQTTKFFLPALSLIDELKKSKAVKLSNLDSALHNLKAKFKPNTKDKGFSIYFKNDNFSSEKEKLDVGQSHYNIQMEYDNRKIVIDEIFLRVNGMPIFEGVVDRFCTNGFLQDKPYHYRLIIPLKKKIDFHFTIEQIGFSTDLGYNSRCATKAIINDETIEVCYIDRNKRDHFLVIDSTKKQSFEQFAEKVFAVQTGLGYLSGHFSGNCGYFFAYNNANKKTIAHFRFMTLRSSMESSYIPIYSNSYGYLRNSDEKAKEYYHLLRTINFKEFSSLCQWLHDSIDFSSTIILILESSIASLLFMPGGFAIALETLSDIIIDKKKLKLAPIKNKFTAKEIRNSFKQILDEYESSILPDDFKTLQVRIDQFNQTTNKSRLRAPFEILGIKLDQEDFKILETRNDFLHGRVPDITESGKNRPVKRMNEDMYYSAMRLYTLLNMVILKQIGYDNYILNHPKIQEKATGISLDEEIYRKV